MDCIAAARGSILCFQFNLVELRCCCTLRGQLARHIHTNISAVRGIGVFLRSCQRLLCNAGFKKINAISKLHVV